jgi:5-methylcytosine-specific restriction endonuclease McrA
MEMWRRMSESKQRRRRHQHILKGNPTCIYCGGVSPATTVEHMPPRVIFWGKDRPKGLEFPSCEQCNNSTRLSDQVAGLMSRIYPDSANPEHGEEVRRLLRAISNNCPGLLEEMKIGRAGQKLARKRVPANVEGGG